MGRRRRAPAMVTINRQSCEESLVHRATASPPPRPPPLLLPMRSSFGLPPHMHRKIRKTPGPGPPPMIPPSSWGSTSGLPGAAGYREYPLRVEEYSPVLAGRSEIAYAGLRLTSSAHTRHAAPLPPPRYSTRLVHPRVFPRLPECHTVPLPSPICFRPWLCNFSDDRRDCTGDRGDAAARDVDNGGQSDGRANQMATRSLVAGERTLAKTFVAVAGRAVASVRIEPAFVRRD
ncbi:hypothetical protein B0H12DRAFT_1117920 [Mycena haematopus]|nr:hypothetical protein B0H12DRAFT_1117920 [Mycena haematopus]